MSIRSLVLIVLLVTNSVFTTTSTATDAPATSNVKIASGVFGIIVEYADGRRDFEASNIVPFLEGQHYGWIIQLGPENARVRWKEVFELPASPTSWGAGEFTGDTEVSQDRKISVTEREAIVTDGKIENFWRVVQGDPVGNYKIQVFLNDKLYETFNFKVIGE